MVWLCTSWSSSTNCSRSISGRTWMAWDCTPRRDETTPPERSSWVSSSPVWPRRRRLWWICSAWVDFPEPMVPWKNRNSAMAAEPTRRRHRPRTPADLPAPRRQRLRRWVVQLLVDRHRDRLGQPRQRGEAVQLRGPDRPDAAQLLDQALLALG